ncbi:hypothetical protein [Luteolibacter sp. AS25]|uniref:hypothetical protein n=1 Tax=Luteolibacter sp. AS25 TaxID=3135776 RepID=UPI00398BA737
MNKPRKQLQPAHIELATTAIAAMALVLALGLQAIGLTARADQFISVFFLPKGMKEPALTLHPALPWVATAFLAIVLPSVILRVAESWRRYLIWALTTLLTVLWAPVLLLSSHEPQISIAIIAVFWSGFCAVFYAHNHSLPVDGHVKLPDSPTNAPR